jgi:hypothetical protein
MKIVFDDNAGIKSDFYRVYNTARGKSILNRIMGSSISEVDIPYIYNTVVSGNIEELNDVIRNWYDDVDSDISSAIEEFDEVQNPLQGEGMTGGANNIRVSTNETTYQIDLSDKERFYYTALPYVNNTHIRIYQTEDINFGHILKFTQQEAIKAIHEYHAQFPAIDLRGELIKFAQQFYADEETCIHNVDEYLKIK